MKKSIKFSEVFDLDKAVVEWSRKMNRRGELEDGMIVELEAHLRDEVEELVGQGMSLEDAFHKVTASVESADVIGREYYKTYARSFFLTPPQRSGGLSFALLLNSIKVSLRKIRRQKWYSGHRDSLFHFDSYLGTARALL